MAAIRNPDVQAVPPDLAGFRVRPALALRASADAPEMTAGEALRLLLLALPLRRRGKAEVEIARLQRVLVLAQRRIVGRHRHRKARRQPVVEQTRALQL